MNRECFTAEHGEKKFVRIIEKQTEEIAQELIDPIISEGDVIGSVVVMAKDKKKPINEVEKKHDYIINELQNSDGVISITGLGLMLGIETEKDVSEVLKECQNNGVLPIKAKNKLRLLPPLNISFEDLKTAVEVIKNACK